MSDAELAAQDAALSEAMSEDALAVESVASGDGAHITLCTDGPLLLRGDFDITDARGNKVDARRGTVALCRCGGSAIKPFCDGTHKLNGFTTQ